MADSDTKPMPPESTDPNAPPPYDMLQPQLQPHPCPQPDPQPQPYPQPQPEPNIQHTRAFVITQQPAPTRTVTKVVAVADNMGLAIFSCLCCFCPLGLAAIVMACQSSDAIARQDVSRAQSKSRTSRCLSVISISIGVLIAIIVIIIRNNRSTYSSYGYN